LHDHVIDVLALRRETKAAGVQPFGQAVLRFAVCGYAHYEEEV